MDRLVLFLPIIFIFHDMEEIVGFRTFFDSNPDIFTRFPKITAPYRNFKTDAFALAVYEEFIPFFGISILAYFVPNYYLYSLWFGLLLAFTFHLFIHIGQSIYIKKYIPSLITSIICLPICFIMVTKTINTITITGIALVIACVGIFLMMLNLKLAHKLMLLI